MINQTNSIKVLSSWPPPQSLAQRQHIHISSPLLATSVVRENNIMADITSHSFHLSQFTKSNSTCQTVVNDMFPLPQNYYWMESQIPGNWSSYMISCLCGKSLTIVLWVKIQVQGLLNIGLTEPTTTQEASIKTDSLPTAHNNNNNNNNIVTAFAARIRTGNFEMSNQVKTKTVADMLSAIANTFQLAGKPPPVHQASVTYTIPVTQLMERYRCEDPPPCYMLP